MIFYLRRRSAFWIWRHQSWESLVGIRHSPTFLRIFICRTNGVVSLQWKGALVTEYGEDYSPFFQPSLRCYGPERRVGTNMRRVTEEKGLFSRSPRILYRCCNIIHHSNVKWISWYRFFLFAAYVPLTYFLSVQTHTDTSARSRAYAIMRTRHAHAAVKASACYYASEDRSLDNLIVLCEFSLPISISISLCFPISLCISICSSLSLYASTVSTLFWSPHQSTLSLCPSTLIIID